ncbi:putative vacuolar cation/proton exchanger 3-like [Capsicum annuum]|uniref:receptor-like protein 33 n=1 Tax=Capsicum annuum TaxID=4072 RepID=UPI001FB0775A|nr:receptor-like protein 33 [Capsicum annuum]KAF3655223.1 putative vacuolar cation/proton exchanger 3-like [Capsicum annuum]KAF3659200.1 putative vacuolar cation/proton exchanger 3-like [Capsicum annuum]
MPSSILVLRKKRNPSVIVMGRSCNLLLPLAVFILLIHFHTSLSTVTNISTDEASLLSFKSHSISFGPNNILATNWSSSSPVCSWIGVSCSSRHHRVVALDISSMQLHEELAHLQRLKLIDVTNNNFTGAIPSFLGLLPNLRIMILSNNQFSGKIPSALTNLTKLEVLRVQRNFLDGEIPRELGDLRYTAFIDMQGNQLTGSIPTSIFNITTMQIIALTTNNLTGKLPITICDHLPNLKVLDISNNYLDGIIPPTLEKCRKLQTSSLFRNELTGTVPRELANLTALTELYLAAQHLEGSIVEI